MLGIYGGVRQVEGIDCKSAPSQFESVEFGKTAEKIESRTLKGNPIKL